MPIETLFINGPRHGGKSTIARMIGEQVLTSPGHYLRMCLAKDEHTNAVVALDPSRHAKVGNGWASMHAVAYTADRVFETLPDGLRTVRELDRRGFAVIEADADPALRHAYPYDYRVFVMPAPQDLHAVFRTPEAAAEALQQVMQDTSAFASEIFGLFDAAGLDDTAGVQYFAPMALPSRQGALEKLDVSETQIRQFINSPIGAEIASRIQLQPAYHGLVESDVVVINTGVGYDGDALDECVERLEQLLGRLRHETRRHSVLYWGDIQRTSDPTHNKLLKRFQQLLAA